MRSMVEGQPRTPTLLGCPSVTPTARHLPVPGRSENPPSLAVDFAIPAL
jgi:hypothetical protein